jgi:hypothetical protein
VRMRLDRIAAPLALLLMAGCAAPARTLYDGPERDPAETVVLAASRSYVFSVNGRRTGLGRDDSAELVILPGTQRLIVHLDEDMGRRYGYVGLPVTFCAAAGHRYTVYPVTDPIARLWQPTIRDDGARGDVALKPCPAAASPAAGAPEAPSTSEEPALTAPAPAAVPVPAPAPPAAVAPPSPPAASPAPAAAPPAEPGTIAAGNPAVLRGPARTRSLDNAPTVAGLEPGATVTLKVLLKKDNGAWWYVQGAGAAGWVRETQLEPVQP